MKITRAPSLRIEGDDGESLVCEWDNKGEPYREGVTLTFEVPSEKQHFRIFLDPHEAAKLRDKFNELVPK